MPAVIQETVLDEKVWNAWQQKGKFQEESTARTLRAVGGTLLAVLALAYAIYRLAR
jgi:hypothetical protein